MTNLKNIKIGNSLLYLSTLFSLFCFWLILKNQKRTKFKLSNDKEKERQKGIIIPNIKQ